MINYSTVTPFPNRTVKKMRIKAIQANTENRLENFSRL